MKKSRGVRPKGSHLGLENHYRLCLYLLNATIGDMWQNHMRFQVRFRHIHTNYIIRFCFDEGRIEFFFNIKNCPDMFF